ncbi:MULTISPECIES: flagella synthesis protein FlgN [unclassified Shewanella]|jgi:flagella synthesis protein FlgN|uniref:flagella synthesis protein FlgN n=1 Tax=unclassified Shewanella TaxID=196818 RepID=UPI000C7B97B1|nr:MULTISPECIES: flagellar protein FlgN [unclassified Shewanella]PKG58579.1 flagellar protein FlgN [Shewanella sp. GutDb-MelDb]PKG75937.1 flagellar protein FlgN [Shewanella sp. GutCb]
MTNLSHLLSSQHTVLTELKAVISQETKALQSQDADTLLSLASTKATLLDSLKHNDEIIATQPDKSTLKTDATLSQQVSEAKALLAECQQLNAENESLIELSLASLNRFSQALQVSRNSASLTYDEKGRTSSISSLGNNLSA